MPKIYPTRKQPVLQLAGDEMQRIRWLNGLVRDGYRKFNEEQQENEPVAHDFALLIEITERWSAANGTLNLRVLDEDD